MTGDTVRELVEREVVGNWSLTNAHDCDLRRCLVPPELRDYDDCGGGHPLDFKEAHVTDQSLQILLGYKSRLTRSARLKHGNVFMGRKVSRQKGIGWLSKPERY